MNITKWRKKQIINTLIFNLFLLTVFAVWYNKYIKPWLQYIDETKAELNRTFDNYQSIEKKWISYNDFLSLEFVKNSPNFTDIRDNITVDVFNSNYQNNDNTISYNYFLEKKEIEIQKIRGNNVLKRREEFIWKILPYYNEFYFTDNSLTDLDIINYFELFLKTFNFDTNITYWTPTITPLREINQTSSSNYSSEIFYFPLDLNIISKKNDILEFLYYVSKINKVVRDLWEVDELEKAFFPFSKKFQFQLDNITSFENKYITNMFDISSITIPEYLDKTPRNNTKNFNQEEWFYNYLKNDVIDLNTEYNINIKLRFYLRWIPNYLIERDIEEFLVNEFTKKKDQYTNLLTEKNKNKNKNINEIEKINNILNYLNELENGQIKKIQTALNNKTNISSIYSEYRIIRNEVLNLPEIR